eukprot:2560335-Heterocapsa_arctica.AAC.1
MVTTSRPRIRKLGSTVGRRGSVWCAISARAWRTMAASSSRRLAPPPGELLRGASRPSASD